MFTKIHAPRPPESRTRMALLCPTPPSPSALHLHAHPAPIHAPFALTPAIKPHRVSSRQPPFFQTTAKLAHPPAGWVGPAGEWSKCVPRRNPLLGERKQVRASVTTNQSPIALPRAIKAKSPVIVRNQALSRQTMKKQNPTITSANGAAPYQPRATLWVRSPYMPPALQGRPTPPIKAKTPAIKANRA